MSDLTYLKQGIFTAFFPESEAGHAFWNELASVTEGTGKVATVKLPQFLKDLRKAGYTVRKSKKKTEAGHDPVWDDIILAKLA